MLTKGKMVTALKKVGIYKGDKNGAMVGLSHLKTYKITELYYQYCVK